MWKTPNAIQVKTKNKLTMCNVKILDYISAKVARSVVEAGLSPGDIENLSTKALGVLQEQGLYALYLYLFSQLKDRNPASRIIFHLWNVLEPLHITITASNGIVHIVALQEEELLSCDPGKFKNILERKFEDEQRAQKARENIIQCLHMVREHGHLWQVNKNIPELSSRIPSSETLKDLNDLSYNLSEDNRRLQCSNIQAHNVFVNLPSVREIMLTDIAWLTTDIDLLLLIRNLYEQILIYTRYYAKAKQQ